MQTWQIALIVVFVAAVAVAGAKAKGPKGLLAGDVKRKTPLSKREQSMYFRLTEVFPEMVVLSQVSFSALITGKNAAVRNRFNRKYADFVLCSKAFQVVAVVELDDASHEGREQQDKDRESILALAGIRVVRFKQVPDAADLLSALAPKESPKLEKSTK